MYKEYPSKIKRFKIILFCSIILALFSIQIFYAQSISDISNQIDISNNQKILRQNDLNSAQQLLSQLNSQQYGLNSNVDSTEKQIKLLENNINRVKTTIQVLENNIQLAQNDLNTQNLVRNENIKKYFMDSYTYSPFSELISGTSNFSNFQINSSINSYIITNKMKNLNEVSDNLINLSNQKEEIVTLTNSLSAQNAQLIIKKSELEQKINIITNNLSTASNNARSIQSDLNQIQKNISNLSSAQAQLIAAENAKLQGSQQVSQQPLQLIASPIVDGNKGVSTPIPTTNLPTTTVSPITGTINPTPFPSVPPILTTPPASVALYNFTGRGRDLIEGHGMGMSQWGMYGMAQDHGFTYDQILKFYYTGVTIGDYVEPNQIVVDGKTNGPISFDNYLAGIGEVPDSWPVEAVKAQVVAARTYAMRTAYLGSDGLSHICGTDACQVYNGGLGKIAFVKATKGKVILYNGAPIVAYYSASHRGCSSTLSDVWGSTNLPYIKSVIDDPYAYKNYQSYDPYHPTQLIKTYNWQWRTNSYTLDQLSNILSLDSRTNVGKLQNITTQKDQCDRVAKINLIGNSGTKTLTGWDFRAIFNINTSYNDYVYSTELNFNKIN